MKIKTAIADYLIADPTISAITTEIFRKRVKKGVTDAPYIVYRLGTITNKLGHFYKNHGYSGYELIFDIVGPYQTEDSIDVIAKRMIDLLGGFQGTIGDRKGSLSFVDREEGYDEKSDFSIVRVTFLVKETF